MVRPLLPKADQGQQSSNLESGAEGKQAKRRCVSSACIPCRKRKSKCDGSMPACSTCTAVYRTECAYEVVDDTSQRRKPGSSKDADASASERGGASSVVLASMRNSTEAEAAEILQQIRSGEAVETLAEALRTQGSLPQPQAPPPPPSSSAATTDRASLESDMADVPGTPTVGRSGETRYFGHTSNLGLVSSEEEIPIRSQVPTESWTRVTHDAGLVGRLLALYFSWQHPLYIIFSQQCFLHDMAQGRAKYCSALLVNAVLACSCSFAGPADVQTGADADFHALSDGFFEEARRLLFEDEQSSLTTVQALAILSLREASCGHDSSGFHYAGRCMRMAIELGLHLGLSGASANRLTPTEIEVRKITFWGCFTLETIWAVCVGRISQLPRTAIRVDKPTLTDEFEARLWKPYAVSGSRFPREVEQAAYPYGLLHQMGSLSEIVNDAIYMFYAPRERFTSKKLLDLYNRYRRWFQAVPAHLRLTQTSTPQVIYLHMYYNTVVLHLFRPLLRVEVIDTDISPRQICNQSAERVSSLAELFQRVYGLQHVCLLMSHCLLSACTVHLLNLPAEAAARDIISIIDGLRRMATHHPFASRCIRIILTLAGKWSIALPEEAERLATLEIPGKWMSLASSPASRSRSPPASTAYFPIFPIRNVVPEATGPSATDLLPTLDGTSATTAAASGLFWTPFPYQGYPLQADFEAGPMDLSAMLDTSGNPQGQFHRDGFRLPVSVDHVFGSTTSTFKADWGQFDWDQTTSDTPWGQRQEGS